MSTGTGQSQPGKRQEHLWPYAVMAAVLLIVFVTAILTPDYFTYKLRLARIESQNRASATNLTATTQPPAASNQGAPKNSPLPGPADKTESGNIPTSSTEPKSSEIFETYGKLLTMLLAFVSVLGVLFGYFVRRSLSDVEEDMRRQVKETMDFWEKEKNRLSGEVTSKLAEIDAKQAEVKVTIASSKQALEALQASANAERQKLTEQGGLTQNAVAAIDADNTIPGPAGGE
jgi:hypothetical protein